MILTTPSATHLDLDATTLRPHPETGTYAFPDGEAYIRVPDIDADRVMVVHSGQPHPNRGIARLLGLLPGIDADVEVFFTYQPYSRQDAEFVPGTVNYARRLVELLVDRFDVSRVHAVDPHYGHRDWAAALDVVQHHAFPRIAGSVAMDDPVVVGPDRGAVDRFGIPGFEKERHGADVSVSGDVDVDGRDVLVFDDIIATGNTMAAAYDELADQGAERIEAAAVHGVMQDGVDRVAATYDALHLTNTVDRDAATVPVEPLIRDAANL